MALPLYYAVVSAAFFLVSVISSEFADAVVVGFIALLLLPAVASEVARARKGKGKG